MSDPDEDVYDKIDQHKLEMLNDYEMMVDSFAYAVELAGRYYLADTVKVEHHRNGWVEVTMKDAWVGDALRGSKGRMLAQANIHTQDTIYVEELAARDYQIEESPEKD